MLYLTYAELPDEVNVEALREKFDANEYIDAICAKKNAESRLQSLAAMELLAKTLELASIETETLTPIRNERGRPSFKGETGIDFSLSHSKRAVACAVMVGKEPRVGVDIEDEPTDEDAERIARRFFSEAERETVKRRGGEGFVEVWTKKEALIKYLDGENTDIGGLDTEKREGESFETFGTDIGQIALCRAKKSEEKAKAEKIILKK